MFTILINSIKDLDHRISFKTIRRKARIVVIGDNKMAFPYELLRKEGYTITYWPKVESIIDLESGKFDLIILDISRETYSLSYPSDKPLWETTKNGLGLLRDLKIYNPAQLIIVFSSQTNDLSQADTLGFADENLGKNSDIDIWKQKIDALLKGRFTPQRYWGEIIRILKSEGVSIKKIREIEQKLIFSIKNNEDFPMETIESSISISSEAVTIISILTQTILSFGARKKINEN